jgi:hypothetical protein
MRTAVAAVALSAAVLGGVAAGAVRGTPGVSSAQTAPESPATPESPGGDQAPRGDAPAHGRDCPQDQAAPSTAS